MPAITDSWLKANNKKRVEKGYEKPDGEGLSVRVAPSGKLTFQYRFRWQGKAARIDFGSYPNLSIREARELHRSARGALEAGRDPRMERAVERSRAATASTNEQIIRAWYEDYCQHEKVKSEQILRSFELHVFPVLGNLPADETHTIVWVELLDKIKSTAPSVAVRVLSNAKQAHRWAYRRRLMREKPLADIGAKEDLRIDKGTRGRSLTDKEIYYSWHALEASRMSGLNKLFIKLCLLWGCRGIELRQAEKSEMDLEAGIWTIPVEKTKTRKKVSRPIVRPIIDEMKPLIETCILFSGSSPYVIPAGNGKALKEGTLLTFPDAVVRSAKSVYGVDLERWSMHDLRKTARTNFSPLTEPHVAEVMLGHTLGPQAIYDHHQYLEEQRAAYSAWYKRLMEIVSTPPR